MEVVRKLIDADRLMSVIALPESFKNRKLEIIVLPIDNPEPPRRKSEIKDVVQSLVGAIPYADMSLADFRQERLGKYETAD